MLWTVNDYLNVGDAPTYITGKPSILDKAWKYIALGTRSLNNCQPVLLPGLHCLSMYCLKRFLLTYREFLLWSKPLPDLFFYYYFPLFLMGLSSILCPISYHIQHYTKDTYIPSSLIAFTSGLQINLLKWRSVSIWFSNVPVYQYFLLQGKKKYQ